MRIQEMDGYFSNVLFFNLFVTHSFKIYILNLSLLFFLIFGYLMSGFYNIIYTLNQIFFPIKHNYFIFHQHSNHTTIFQYFESLAYVLGWDKDRVSCELLNLLIESVLWLCAIHRNKNYLHIFRNENFYTTRAAVVAAAVAYHNRSIKDLLCVRRAVVL